MLPQRRRPFQILSVKKALAIIQNVQKLAGGKNKNSDNGNAYLYSGRFPVSIFRFPASTLNVGQRERPRFMSVLVGICLLARRIIKL